MEKTFQLPNEVSCSDGVESETAHNAHNAENRTKITTSEYKKVAALSTSSISRPSKVTPDKIEGDERVAVDASTLAKQATALRRLKWISALLAISTVINSATFGGLTHSLMERIENNERLSARLEDALLMRTSTNEAHISADTTDIETRLLKVESTQAQDRTEFQTISTRIGTLEANIDTNIATSQENSDRLMAIERADIKLERNRTEIQSAMSVQNTSIQFVMGRLAQLDTDISEEMTNVLLQETKLMQVEANMVVQNASLQTLSSKWENLESQGIIDQDMISNNTARLTGVETNLSETNVNLQVLKSTNQAQATRILELELGANETMNKFEDYGIRLTNATEQITEVEATIATVIKNHTSRITNLENDFYLAEDAITNHTSKIVEIETNRQSDVAEIQAHYARILGLEQADNESNAVLEKHTDTLGTLGLSARQAFMVRLTNDLTPAPNQTIIYDKVIVDLDNNYDPIQGTFTAKINGTYLFSVEACSGPNHYIHLSLQRNHVEMGTVIGSDKNVHDCSSNTFVFPLVANDVVWVQHKIEGDLMSVDYSDNNFAGVLIHPS